MQCNELATTMKRRDSDRPDMDWGRLMKERMESDAGSGDMSVAMLTSKGCKDQESVPQDDWYRSDRCLMNSWRGHYRMCSL